MFKRNLQFHERIPQTCASFAKMSETYQGLSFLADLLAQFILFSPCWRKKREKNQPNKHFS